MKRLILAALLAGLASPALAQSFGGSNDTIQNGPDDNSTVNDDTTDFGASSNRTDSDLPETAPPSQPGTAPNAGLSTYEQVPGAGVSGSESGTSSSSLPDIGTPSPSTPSTAEGPSANPAPNAGPTLPEMAPGDQPTRNP